MKRRRNRNIALVVAFVAASCGLSACAKDESRSARTTSSQASDPNYPDSVYQGLDPELNYYDVSGGSLAEAMGKTVFAQFQELTGVKVTQDYNEDNTKFIAASQAGKVPWSLIGFASRADFVQARDEGYLAPLADTVPVDMLRDGTYEKYGFQSDNYGIVLAYNTDKYPDPETAPDSLLDLYDAEDFPGKRCMFQYHEFGAVFESALMADGVEKADVYPLDIPRALAKLNTIKSDIVWWTSGDESIQDIVQGECDLGVTWSGRAYSAIQDGEPIAMTWGDALYDTGYLAVTKNGPNPEAAQALAAYWLQNYQAQAERAELVPYTIPYNDSVPVHYSDDLAPYVPAGANLDTAIQQDNDYYIENVDEVTSAFNEWVSE